MTSIKIPQFPFKSLKFPSIKTSFPPSRRLHTKAHSTQSRLQNQQNHPNKFALVGDFKHHEAENQDECRLETHHEELRDDVGCKNFDAGDA